MSPARLDAAAANEHIHAVAVGTMPGPVEVQPHTTLASLLGILTRHIHPPSNIREKNKNPCVQCSKNHQRCIVVSAPGTPVLCEKCRGRGLLCCVLKEGSSVMTPPAPMDANPEEIGGTGNQQY